MKAKEEKQALQAKSVSRQSGIKQDNAKALSQVERLSKVMADFRKKHPDFTIERP